MNNNRIKVTIEEQIAHVCLTRPEKHNALDIKMFKAIDNTIKKLKKNRDIRAIIVSGAGPDFCTGLDIKSVMRSPLNAMQLLFKWLPWRANLAQRVSTGWRELPVPVIMALSGRCWGGGLQIALGADFRIAHPETSLAIMEAKWGLIPDMGGTLALRTLLNQDVAKKLAMTGQELTAEQALALGLILEVDDQPLEKAKKLAGEICRQSPDAVSAVKRLYNKSWWSGPGAALARESAYQLKVLAGKNQKIKTFNQTHDKAVQKDFTARGHW
ncbi:crotonase/enoyl-CoA hydratase family protein [Thalassomonas haliotis]|uniref:Crotonase/enoyl-CoA hydratase family protein n=1 Tax=Thalassomonas haliotis TaxID=485448 RepID=A0ABY7VLG0_9GAMM|nr:crotonase/enoyl-CoA hydratase family protein [Thalassomonas haliotis]WDE14113.1 crotonase/enoyl-CoA hydratase family protein [Thalassomonas haliotis]